MSKILCIIGYVLAIGMIAIGIWNENIVLCVMAVLLAIISGIVIKHQRSKLIIQGKEKKEMKLESPVYYFVRYSILALAWGLLSFFLEWKGISLLMGILFLVMFYFLFLYWKTYPMNKRSQEYTDEFLKTKDAVLYLKNEEEILKMAEKNHSKQIHLTKSNLAVAMIYAGEHEKAEALMRELLLEIEQGKIKKNAKELQAILVYNIMYNAVYQDDMETIENMAKEYPQALNMAKSMMKVFLAEYFEALSQKDYQKAYQVLSDWEGSREDKEHGLLQESVGYLKIFALKRQGKTEQMQEEAEQLRQTAKLKCVVEKL